MALLPFTSADSHFRDHFGRDADDFLSQFLNPHGGMMLGSEIPQPKLRIIPVDVTETTDAYQLKADLPCVAKGDITLEEDEGVIRIGVTTTEGEDKEEESPDKKWHRRERRSFVSFQERRLRMPENADFETMTSSFADGTLTIDVKKLAVLPTAAPKARRITIA